MNNKTAKLLSKAAGAMFSNRPKIKEGASAFRIGRKGQRIPWSIHQIYQNLKSKWNGSSDKEKSNMRRSLKGLIDAEKTKM